MEEMDKQLGTIQGLFGLMDPAQRRFAVKMVAAIYVGGLGSEPASAGVMADALAALGRHTAALALAEDAPTETAPATEAPPADA